MIGRLKFEIDELVNAMLDQLPQDVIIHGTVLDPSIAGGQIVKEIERRKRAAGKTDSEIHATVFGIEENILRKNYAVNKNKLVGNYTVGNFLKDKSDMRVDLVIMNSPYTNGQVMVYTKFFEKALAVGDTVVSVMPLDLQSKHDKLKFHNERVLRHQVFVSDNVSDYFNVAYDNLHYVIAKESVENEVLEIADPLDSIPLLYPERARLVPIKGDTDIAIGEEIEDGVETIFKVHKNDKVLYKKVDQYKIDKSSKKSKSPYLVIVNHTPSQGRFNCVVLPNTGLCWSMWTFAFEADSLENANKLKAWIKSPIIVKEIKNMLVARNNQHTISKVMIERLPTYE